ncbi:hypothetical protein I316_04537 [Kwoniella heveanensis BCC8398]|uniref:Uncharacterized protein n=1 Tax=Kwoniella heveanensis BCC8398 TaxID=1296120 RepID=A0A1B9GSJ5_9TREE|nr:hypothetical protein I316_04537 [Kwoniella heveanensis BCC8398]
MGGNAFGIPARRLPQKQYLSLKAHALYKVQPFFKAVLVPRNLTTKETHGDLDLLCAYDANIPGGDEAWSPKEASQSEPAPKGMDDGPQLGSPVQAADNTADKPDPVLAILPEPASGHNIGGQIKIYGGRIFTGAEVEAIRDLCGEIKQSLGAVGWWRRGNEVSFKMPCAILGQDAEHDVSPDEFYQIDMNLVKFQYLDFYHDMASYSSTGVLLGRIVRHLSKSFTLHLTHIVVRHSPFSGIAPVGVTLTTSPSALAAWLGLDYKKWVEQGEGWSEEKQLFEWMTNVDEDSILVPALQRLSITARRDANEETGKRKKRADYADRFYDWLRTDSKWAVSTPADGGGQVEGPSEAPTPLSPTPMETPAASQASPAQSRTVSLRDFFDKTADQPATPTDVSRSHTFYVNLAPEPKPLDAAAQAALDYWGKKDEYDALVTARREVAFEVARLQFEKHQRRAAAALAAVGDSEGQA